MISYRPLQTHHNGALHKNNFLLLGILFATGCCLESHGEPAATPTHETKADGPVAPAVPDTKQANKKDDLIKGAPTSFMAIFKKAGQIALASQVEIVQAGILWIGYTITIMRNPHGDRIGRIALGLSILFFIAVFILCIVDLAFSIGYLLKGCQEKQVRKRVGGHWTRLVAVLIGIVLYRLTYIYIFRDFLRIQHSEDISEYNEAFLMLVCATLSLIICTIVVNFFDATANQPTTSQKSAAQLTSTFRQAVKIAWSTQVSLMTTSSIMMLFVLAFDKTIFLLLPARWVRVHFSFTPPPLLEVAFINYVFLLIVYIVDLACSLVYLRQGYTEKLVSKRVGNFWIRLVAMLIGLICNDKRVLPTGVTDKKSLYVIWFICLEIVSLIFCTLAINAYVMPLQASRLKRQETNGNRKPVKITVDQTQTATVDSSGRTAGVAT